MLPVRIEQVRNFGRRPSRLVCLDSVLARMEISCASLSPSIWGSRGPHHQGWGAGLYAFLKGLELVLGGTEGVYELINSMDEGQNPGNVRAAIQHEGFYAIKATKVCDSRGSFVGTCCILEDSLTVESLVWSAANAHDGILPLTPGNVTTNHEDARVDDSGIAVNFFRGTSLVATAGEPGLLVEQDACSAMEFDSALPVLLDIPVPTGKDAIASPPLTDCGKDGCQADLGPSPTSQPGSDLTSFPVTSGMHAQPLTSTLLVALWNIPVLLGTA